MRRKVCDSKGLRRFCGGPPPMDISRYTIRGYVDKLSA